MCKVWNYARRSFQYWRRRRAVLKAPRTICHFAGMIDKNRFWNH